LGVCNDAAAVPHWTTAELYAEIVWLLDRAIVDEDRQPELDAQLENIYRSLADPRFTDGFGAAVAERAVDAYVGTVDCMAARGAVLDVLLGEYQRLWEQAGRTFGF
jgi:hypothetical protein